MERIRGFVLQKVGPLPVWAWAAIVLALILGYMWFTKTGIFGSGSGSGSADNSAAGAGSGSLDSLGGGGALGSGGGTIDPTQASTVPVAGNGSAGMGLPYAAPSSLDLGGISSAPAVVAASGPAGIPNPFGSQYAPIIPASVYKTSGTIAQRTFYRPSAPSSPPVAQSIPAQIASNPVGDYGRGM